MDYAASPRLTQPKEAARPRQYDEEVAFTIMARLADGEPLHVICADRSMPHPVTFYRWLAEHDGFARAYHFALMARFDKAAYELIEIVDDAADDFVIEHNDDGSIKRKINVEALERTRDRIRLRQWIMQKELPRKYADLPATEAAPPPKQLEPPPSEDTSQLARNAVAQLLASRALTEAK